MSASKVSPFFRYNYIVFPLLFQEDSRFLRGNHMCFPYRSPFTISRSSEKADILNSPAFALAASPTQATRKPPA